MPQWAGYRDREKSFDCAVRWRRAASLSFVTHQLFMNPSETFQVLRFFLTLTQSLRKFFITVFPACLPFEITQL